MVISTWVLLFAEQLECSMGLKVQHADRPQSPGTNENPQSTLQIQALESHMTTDRGTVCEDFSRVLAQGCLI